VGRQGPVVQDRRRHIDDHPGEYINRPDASRSR
jgi:hypothetical protein